MVKWERQESCSQCDGDGCADCDPIGTVLKICSGEIQVDGDACGPENAALIRIEAILLAHETARAYPAVSADVAALEDRQEATPEDAKKLADLLCPPHANLDAAGHLMPFDNCIACIRVQRDELLAAQPQLCPKCSGVMEPHGQCSQCGEYVANSAISGVPSEATPSKHTTWKDVKAQMDATPTKENAPPLDEPCSFTYGNGAKCCVQRRNHNTMREHGNSHDWTAPAPEVYGHTFRRRSES